MSTIGCDQNRLKHAILNDVWTHYDTTSSLAKHQHPERDAVLSRALKQQVPANAIYSISHTAGIGVALWLDAQKHPTFLKVGVDLERAARTPPSKAVQRRVFSASELDAVHRGEITALELWCVKEAVWKATPCNEGLRLPQVTVDIASQRDESGEIVWGIERLNVFDQSVVLAWAISLNG
jgi:4'-phosphopantetheinyl transferase EntD